MSHGDVAIDAMELIPFLFVVQMGLPAVLAKTQWKVILMTTDAGGLKDMPLGILYLRFGFPVKGFWILKELSPKISETGTGFFRKITLSMWWEVTINAVNMNASFVVVMGG